MSTPKPTRRHWLLAGLHLAAWLPLANLARDVLVRGWPINPIQDWTFGTGLPALIFLVLTLAITPLLTLTGWSALTPLRRWLGLYAFFYALLHVSIFVVLDYGLDLALMWDTVLEKRYILAGLGAFVILLPLALTSTRGWQKRLGREWKVLHRGAYVAAGLAVLHFAWLVKADLTEPLLYGAAVAGLLVLRLPAVRRRLAGLRHSRAAGAGRPGPASDRA
ncbi:MAG: sulfoxide reductase heme-binding subunit YedZ [Anaerolineales bacterium]|nr:sulfoxide reductase heme-binding subunit YedZ [Anaerolineales bacterium]